MIEVEDNVPVCMKFLKSPNMRCVEHQKATCEDNRFLIIPLPYAGKISYRYNHTFWAARENRTLDIGSTNRSFTTKL